MNMSKESKMHRELFNWLREQNLPENNIPRNEKEWFREIAVGFNRLGMEKPDLSESYRRAAEDLIIDENVKRILIKQQQLGLLDFDLYKKIAQREWSRNYGFFKPSLIQSIDYVCIIGKRGILFKLNCNSKNLGSLLMHHFRE